MREPGKHLPRESARERRLSRRAHDDSDIHGTRFTVLDFFLICVVVLSVLGVAFRGTIAELFAKVEPSSPIEIGFMAEGLDTGLADQVKIGDRLDYDNELFGTISTVSVEAGKKLVTDVDGNGKTILIEADDLHHCTVKGTLTINGRYTDSGLVTENNESVCVGKILKIYTSSYSLTVTITEIPRK